MMKLLKMIPSKWFISPYVVSTICGKVIFQICVYMALFSRAITFLYPYGATLNVMKPAVAVLSTGSECFPFNRPVLAFHQGKVRCIDFHNKLVKSAC